LTADSFIASRRPRWAELEALRSNLARGRLRSLEAGEVERFAALYRRAASDLAIARRDYPDHPITEYLNSLCARAHVMLHRGRAPRARAALELFARGAPRRFRASAGYFLASLACLLGGVLAGWLAYDLRPDLRGILVPDSLFGQMAQGLPGVALPQPLLAAPSIFVHNIVVAGVMFVAGIVVGLPSAFLVFVNGWSLGTLGAAVHSGGYDLAFWSLIAAHGVLELSIIVTAGAGGLRLGDALLRPGSRSRGDALAGAAHDILGLVLATLVLLVVSGCVEAFISPSGLPDAAKIAIGLGLGTGFYAWLLLAGREPRAVAGLDLDAAAAGEGPPLPHPA
jgi:uncharacterized membrane protein SpoIIM required for sporulation